MTAIVAGSTVVGLVAITGMAVLVRGGDDGKDRVAAGATSSSSPSANSPSAPTSSPTASVGGSATSQSLPATTSAAATTTPRSPHARTTYTGHGNKVVQIHKPGNAVGPVLVVAAHRGAGSFGVLTLDSTLHESGILINVAGSYQGTTLLDAQGTQTQNLKVRARGSWTLHIKPVTAARSVGARAKGTGDDVLRYTGTTGVAAFDCRGGLNFVVSYYGQKVNAVLVNEVGRYHGQVRIQKGPALVTVQANAAWHMLVAP